MDLWHLSYEKRLKRLDMPTLDYRKLRCDITATFKLLNSKIGHNKKVSQGPLNRADTAKSLPGHGKKIKLDKLRIELWKNSFSQHVNEWNNFPTELISSQRFRQFKSRLDHWKYRELK